MFLVVEFRKRQAARRNVYRMQRKAWDCWIIIRMFAHGKRKACFCNRNRF